MHVKLCENKRERTSFKENVWARHIRDNATQVPRGEAEMAFSVLPATISPAHKEHSQGFFGNNNTPWPSLHTRNGGELCIHLAQLTKFMPVKAEEIFENLTGAVLKTRGATGNHMAKRESHSWYLMHLHFHDSVSSCLHYLYLLYLLWCKTMWSDLK